MKDDPGKNHSPTATRWPPAAMLEKYDRDREAARMKRDGHTWDEIAATLGYASRGRAYSAVKSRMLESQKLTYGEVELYRAETLERLEALLLAVMPMALKASEKHVESARRLIKQISDLRGEAQPVKVEIGESDVDRLLREATDEFNRRAADLDRQAGAAAGDASTAG
jgi:hypothetical protein